VIALLSLGNVLMGDDGFGPAAVQAFEAQYAVDDDVHVVDLGTPGLDLLPWLADVEHVILVDTVKSGDPPGTMRIYDKAAILKHPPSARIGPHDPGVKEALLALEFAGRAPQTVTLIAVVPERIEMSLTLTPTVAATLPAAVSAIVGALERLGVAVGGGRDRAPAPAPAARFSSPVRAFLR
jgi:hydrogenase maturation protease